MGIRCAKRSLFSRTTLFVASAIAIVSGCGELAGLNELEFRDRSDSGGSENHGGSVGAEAGSASSAVGGSNPSLGGIGEAGSTAFGGASGDTSEPKIPQQTGCDGLTPFTPNFGVLRSCILRVACNPFAPIWTVSECVSQNTQRAVDACTSNARTCADIQRCEGVGYENSEFCRGKAGWQCDGNVARNCDGNVFLDCEAFGGTCDVTGPGANKCLVLDSCPNSNPGVHCSENIAYTCANERGYGKICGKDQTLCAGPTNDKHCQRVLSPCAGEGAACVDTEAQICTPDGLLKYDCASVGLACDLGRCVAPGCSTASSPCEENCVGSQLQFCYGGARVAVDCKAFGLNECVIAYRKDTKYATCQP